MTNLAALVEYDGTRFKGFQRQAANQGPTVQGAIEDALARLAGKAITLEGAGRTDSGVHAAGQVINFHTTARHTPATWARALNALLPEDIAVRAVCVAPETFRARRSALARHYRYRILCAPTRAPLRERYVWRVPAPLDVAAMDAAAAHLLGTHDFGAFGSSPRDQRATGVRGHTVRTLSVARCRAGSQVAGGGDGPRSLTDEIAADEIACDFTANAFLTGMVRRMVGTLVLVGRGLLAADGVGDILAAHVPAHPGTPAPARGLCVMSVDYPAGMLDWEPLA